MISFTPGLAGVVDEGGEHALGVAEVLGHGAAGVAPDEGADGGAPEPGGGVDAAVHVLVVGGPLGRVGVEVVVVVGERGEREAVAVEQRLGLVGLLVAEAVGVEVGGDEGAVAEVGPGGHLEGLEALRRGPGADVLQAPLGQAGGEEPELHGATSWRSAGVPAVTSTQPPSRDERSTASVISTARTPSAKVGSPSTAAPPPRRPPAGCRPRRRRSSPGSPAGGRGGRWRRAPRSGRGGSGRARRSPTGRGGPPRGCPGAPGRRPAWRRR